MNIKTCRRSSMFPKTLSQCIEPITRPVLKTQGLAGSLIISEWPSIIGEKLSAHCIPQKLSFPPGKKTDGTLRIAVENGFATELQHLQPVILERLSTYFGYKAVAQVIIAHTYTPELEKLPALPRKASLPPHCVSIAEGVEDEALRAALTGIAKTLSGIK